MKKLSPREFVTLAIIAIVAVMTLCVPIAQHIFPSKQIERKVAAPQGYTIETLVPNEVMVVRAVEIQNRIVDDYTDALISGTTELGKKYVIMPGGETIDREHVNGSQTIAIIWHVRPRN